MKKQKKNKRKEKQKEKRKKEKENNSTNEIYNGRNRFVQQSGQLTLHVVYYLQSFYFHLDF